MERELGGVVLKVDHLNSGAFLKDISFELRAGEILGFRDSSARTHGNGAGHYGSGQEGQRRYLSER